MGSQEQLQAMQQAMNTINKQFGKGAVMSLGSTGEAQNLSIIPTGSLKLDAALGVGGLPLGRIVEIFGPESSGKTTMALTLIAEALKLDPSTTCAIVDTEHALDIDYVARLGIDKDRVMLSQPNNAEEALETVDILVRSGICSVVVLDSVAALVPKAEVEGEMGDAHMGLQARLMSQALRKLTSSIAKSNCIVLFINQIRQKIGVMFGNPETTAGGNALKFYASVRMDIRRVSTITIGKDNPIGNEVRIRVVKNKVSRPGLKADTVILFGKGIDIDGEIIDLATEYNLIDKSGSWYTYKDAQGAIVKLGQGKDAVKQYLQSNLALRETLLTTIRQILKDPKTEYASRNIAAQDSAQEDSEEE